ncbi:MAG: lipoate--protein ligase family protein [Actinobacteria bacterium]|nr:MAG: lipoate--protein ligase family protein [Actinomycetota bacterium]
MAREWRLIVDGAVDGAMNMGIDEALLESVANGGPPTLRIYRWDRPTVSLGRFQRLADVAPAVRAREGVPVVRRPTGGRGVLHGREVTYSVAATVHDGVPRGTAASYAHLCEGLTSAFRLLGVPAELTRRDRGARSGACYLHATRADLSLGAAKLSGSAQVWRRDAVLQHGSVVIERDVALEAALFRLDGPAEARLAVAAVGLAEVLGETPGPEQVERALVEGFGAGLGVAFTPGELTADERERAARRAVDAACDV